jgi:hypothetical protein
MRRATKAAVKAAQHARHASAADAYLARMSGPDAEHGNKSVMRAFAVYGTLELDTWSSTAEIMEAVGDRLAFRDLDKPAKSKAVRRAFRDLTLNGLAVTKQRNVERRLVETVARLIENDVDKKAVSSAH